MPKCFLPRMQWVSLPARTISAWLFCASLFSPVADAIEQVRVTAQRYEQNLQDVPLSVTVIDGDEIRRDSIVDIGELTARVPGFSANTRGLPTLYLRGIGSNDLGAGGDPSVGVYQDGIYLGRSAGQIFDLLDVERVEVIRGPQGVLFGRNSAGGAINVIARKPERNMSAELSAQYGSFNEQRLTAVANAPLSEDWSVRVAANSLRRDGFVHNAYNDSDMLDADQWAARGTLLFDPGTAWQMQLQLSTENKNADGAHGRSANASFLPGDPFDDYYSDLDHGLEERDLLFGNFRVEYAANAWQFESITAYRVLHYDDLVDSTGTGLRSVRLYAGTDEENRQLSQDFVLHRVGDTAQITLGASYYRQNADQLSHFESTSETVNYAVSRQLGFPIRVLAPGRYHEENSHNGGEFKTLSAFSDAVITLDERWDLLAGARYSYDEKHHFVDGMGSNNGVAIVFPDTPRTPTHANWNDWSPRAGVNFRATPSTLLYVSYSEGYKSGGFNSFVPSAEFAPESVDQIEVGAKWHGWQEHLHINAAVFDYRYSDLQVSVIESGRPVIRNAAAARGRGMDLDIGVQFTEAWRAGIIASWLDAEFDDFETRRGTTTVNYAGNALTFTPDKQLSSFIAHATSIGAGLKLSSVLRYSFSGKQYFDVSNNPSLTENAVNLWEASIALAERNDRWQLVFFAQNLTNEEYVVSLGGIARETLDAPTSRRGMPRMLGVRAEWRWKD